MTERDGVLSLLGLCLRGRNLAVGDEAAAEAAGRSQARLLLVAADAGPRVHRRAEALSLRGGCLVETLPFTREEVGGALGRGSAALCAVTDTGLAAAVMRRLEGLCPGRYSRSLERLELKGRRAAERRLRGPRPGPAGAPPRRREKASAGAGTEPGGRPGGRRERPGTEGSVRSPGEGGRRGRRAAGDGGAVRSGRDAHSRPVKKGRGAFRRKGD